MGYNELVQFRETRRLYGDALTDYDQPRAMWWAPLCSRHAHSCVRRSRIVITKDRDFPDLLARLGPPPQVIWVTGGNTSNARMRQLFEELFPQALLLLQGGDVLVEITDVP